MPNLLAKAAIQQALHNARQHTLEMRASAPTAVGDVGGIGLVSGEVGGGIGEGGSMKHKGVEVGPWPALGRAHAKTPSVLAPSNGDQAQGGAAGGAVAAATKKRKGEVGEGTVKRRATLGGGKAGGVGKGGEGSSRNGFLCPRCNRGFENVPRNQR